MYPRSTENSLMVTLLAPLLDSLRTAARDGITKVVRVGQTTVKICVKVVFDRSK